MPLYEQVHETVVAEQVTSSMLTAAALPEWARSKATISREKTFVNLLTANGTKTGFAGDWLVLWTDGRITVEPKELFHKKFRLKHELD